MLLGPGIVNTIAIISNYHLIQIWFPHYWDIISNKFSEK